ncbi:probable multidrug resistance-associated protein lethal(2)03659 [Orussus abietinus]|uniref:probable multidrug resistance-associated protein lethal(2)03659 n=1 Tax=Orussus abietinus TaxID=222816 RepID=UPI000624F6DF|nr:probable multidrug resistance-associated protein lethal(2)03659 [Orussus abietinus]XP_023290437.1 probable multidrug resistance-associated protein lethal(2)03659 [Orussus abietinus]XP_023290440.1 probable multidrug resistance-associated protein lethal(2)03659 [Orussus abietinus]
MDSKAEREKVKNPREGANPLSVLTFSWILRTFWLGYQRDLEVTDLYSPLKEHTSSILGEKISSAWQDECKRISKYQKQRAKRKDGKGEDKDEKGPEPSLMRVLIKCFGTPVMFYGIALAIMEILLRVMQPLFLARLLQYYEKKNSSITKEEAYLYAGGVVMCSAINIFVIHPYMMAILHMGMKIRVACCSLIYRKALRLSKTALGETTVGQAVNLLSNDVNRFDVAIIFLHYLWIGPLETMIVMYFMYREVENSAIIGVASLLMFIPLQGFLGKRSSVLRLRTAIRTDERVRLTNEIIGGIQAIKMYTWEKPFSALVDFARRKEVNVIRATSYIRGVIMSFIIFTTRLSLFITVLHYVLASNSKGRINAEIVFMLTAYYNILRQTMTVFFPQGITQVAEAIVSIRRLQKFMLYEEVGMVENAADDKQDTAENSNSNEKNKSEPSENNKKESVEKIETNDEDGTILMENCYAKWVLDHEEDTLQNINIKVKPGELVAVVGQVGSGKTSLLHVLLKELPIQSGTLQVKGKIAYASQEPWLFAGSVRQNILFGRKMDHRRYENVVNVCQLKRDFSLLPFGDKTIVGERGISLSGGQRARVNLARAVYADAAIYLLDDPLSAVDTHVGKHMFQECIDKYLKGKTRILVTHQIQHLSNADRIIVLKDGVIQAEGTYSELGAMGVDFGRLLEVQTQTDEQVASAPASRSNSRHTSITSLSSFMTNDTNKQQDEPAEVAEMRSVGTVGGWVYLSYLRAGGNWGIVIGIFLLCVFAQMAASGGDFFIARWVSMEEQEDKSAETGYVRPLSSEVCIYIYTALTVLTIIVTLARSFSFFAMCMRASMRLHNRMFQCICRATMRFFNTNTSGRILNRFSKDMGAIDELLPTALIDCVQIGLTLLGIIAVVAIANPWLLVPTVFVGIIFYYLRVFYLSTSRSVKRLEGVTRSPVFAHLNATLQGMTTIRAFDAGKTLTKEFDHHQDLHSSSWYIFIASSRAFGFWLDVICVIYIALVTLSFLVLYSDDNKPDGGNVGLAITQSIGLTGMFQWGMRQSAELENQMTSVERVLEYTNVESEPPLESTPEKKPPKDWPQSGKMEFKEVFLRYSPTEPPVLKNLNFVIQPREKIGIVGRTGAGKSSLISALFRLADIEGQVVIDGVAVGEIGLHDLRSKISIIPQEPFLFSGTLRRNLDPFDSYTDDVLWRALEEVELKEMGLEAHVTEGGTNLSVGQRQLVCLARAIVQNNPILVLDEATANVDPRTDELIQTAIRQKFENNTVLTIAHRLNTVMDSDRILVMDAGTVVEFDHPHLLLQKEKGYLQGMVKQTGRSMAEALTAVARKNYLERTSTTL